MIAAEKTMDGRHRDKMQAGNLYGACKMHEMRAVTSDGELALMEKVTSWL